MCPEKISRHSTELITLTESGRLTAVYRPQRDLVGRPRARCTFAPRSSRTRMMSVSRDRLPSRQRADHADQPRELAINGPVPSSSSRSPTPSSRTVRSPTPMEVDTPPAPAEPSAPPAPPAPPAPTEETEAVREVRKDMSNLRLGKRSRGSLSTFSYPACKHIRRNDA